MMRPVNRRELERMKTTHYKNISCFSALFMGLLTMTAHADDLRYAAPPEVPAMKVEPQPMEQEKTQAIAADATPILESLKGIVLIPDGTPAALQRLATGVDTALVSFAQSPAMADYLQKSIGQPASLHSLQHLVDGITRQLRLEGQLLVSVWLPPQDLTDGVVRIVVRPTVMEGDIQVVGAQYFSPESYKKWIRQLPDQTLDMVQLQQDIDWINRNPFRHATPAAASGSVQGSSRVSVRVQERRPVRVFAGADNTGTESTDEQRIFAGFNWGNAFGRGDQLSYQYRTDPGHKRSTTHSGSYLADLPWRHWLALSAAWSETTPDLGPAFDQTGKSWQVGLQYHVPLPTVRQKQAALKQDAYVGLDFKYTNNNLEFAAIPVMNNKTHVAQVTLGYSLNREGQNSSSFLSPQLVLSPGGLSKYNDNQAFDGSRQGAHARYAYWRLDAEHAQRLPAGWRWDVRANGQYSNVPLLGSEQIAGSGVQAVRGYPESQAFGDQGLVLRNELHLPVWALGQSGESSLGAFAFYDAAWLRTVGQDAGSTKLDSIGLGASLRLGSAVTLDVSAGKPLKRHVAGEEGTRVHVRLQVAY